MILLLIGIFIDDRNSSVKQATITEGGRNEPGGRRGRFPCDRRVVAGPEGRPVTARRAGLEVVEKL
jgi:hypothetical protein